MLGVVVGLAVCVSLLPVVRASDLEEELRYIDALQRMEMPDFATEIIAEARKRFTAAEYPEIGAELKVRENRSLLSQGKFEAVQKVVDAVADKNSPEYWALYLAMADAYHRFSQYAEADKRYLEFFKKVEKPPAALVTFYRDSAYKYAQMLLGMNRDVEALAAYRHLFKIPLEEAVLRQVQADVAELIIKLAPAEQKKETRDAMLKEAEGLVDKLLWKQDIWFGKAIVMKAHITLLRGNLKGARDLVENYMPQLKIIHDDLLEQDPNGTLGLLRMSPMPQCRYLLAVMLLDEAQKEIKKGEGANDDHIKDLLVGEREPSGKRKGNGAAHHFANVFVRFPESQWAADAGERLEVVRKLVKTRYNADIGMRVTEEDLEKVRKTQFAGAQLLFNQSNFKAAAEKYLLALNQFPESKESVAGLGDLAIAYIEMSDKDTDAALMADVVTGYLSERFSAKPALMRDAGDQVRRIGNHYASVNMEAKKRETYEMFFRDYPEHYAAGQLIMSFAERELAAGNTGGAKIYYRQIADLYTNSTSYFDALSRLAQVEKTEGNHLGEIGALEFYITKLSEKGKPSHALVIGKFRLADAQREFANALMKGGATNALPEEASEQEVAEAAQKAQAEATGWLIKAGAGLAEVIKLLTDAPNDYQVNADEKKRNEQTKELAVFLRAVCLAQTQHAADQMAAFRKEAAAAFEAYVKQYPQGQYAPKALLQAGTLYTILQDVNAAQAAFEKLSKDYPTSDEAKNSVPMLAATLIEMGFRAEGVAKYRQMFAAGGSYTEGQFMAAALALEEAREHDMALQAYDKVMSLAKDVNTLAPAKLGRARILAAQKRYADAHKLLQTFIKEHAKLALVVDANFLLVEVASEEGKVERDDEARKKLFNEAVDSLRMVLRYRPEMEKEIALMAGEMHVRKMEAEKQFGLTAQAADSRGLAIVAFNNLIFSIEDPTNVKVSAIVEKAYFYTLPLMLEHKMNDVVIESAEDYLKAFPVGRYRTDVQNWLNQAR